jgi:hypothetical protein
MIKLPFYDLQRLMLVVIEFHIRRSSKEKMSLFSYARKHGICGTVANLLSFGNCMTQLAFMVVRLE